MNYIKIWWVSFIFTLLLSPQLIGQTATPDPSNFDRFLSEVYTGKGKKLVKPDTRRYTFMKEFYNERLSYVKSDSKKLELSDFTKLSQIDLYNTYNKGLVRDGSSFNPQSFNPFKYALNFYGFERQLVHVDGTDYIIVIEPQKRGDRR